MKNTKKIFYIIHILLFSTLIFNQIWLHKYHVLMTLLCLYYYIMYHRECEKPKTTNINAENVDITIK